MTQAQKEAAFADYTKQYRAKLKDVYPDYEKLGFFVRTELATTISAEC